jgi:hypothetical protein
MASAANRAYMVSSIGLKRILVVDPQCGALIFFSRNAIPGDQQVNVGAHKATERVLRGTHNRFAADIEAGVDQNRAAGTRLEGGEQGVVARVGFLMNSLDAR